MDAGRSLRRGRSDTNIYGTNLRLFCHCFSQMKSSSLLSYQTLKWPFLAQIQYAKKLINFTSEMQLNLYFIVWYDNNEDDFICEKQWQRTNEDWFHKYSCRSSRASEIFLPASHGHVCDCGASQSAGRRGPSLRVFSPLSSNDW